MKISVIAPVHNESQFIGYSIMSILPWVHEIIYALSPNSDDGTFELLMHIKKQYAHEKLRFYVDESFSFNPLDMPAYNAAFNFCIEKATGDACWFFHPDMVALNGEALLTMPEKATAWWTNVTSYAGDLQTVITKGRCTRWKNIHRKTMGLTYSGGYGSQNEDFYHAQITGKSYKHYGDVFSKYPFEVANSGIDLNHYCELKPYKRRLEKMKLCLKTLAPAASATVIDECATQHPRVSLEPSSTRFGEFKFERTDNQIPEVFAKHRDEFEKFQRSPEWLQATA